MIIGWCGITKRVWLLDSDVLLRHYSLYFADQTRVHLTPHETKLMELFLLKRGRPVEFFELVEYLYNDRSPEIMLDPYSTVKVYVARLRGKFRDRLEFFNHWGRGYELRKTSETSSGKILEESREVRWGRRVLDLSRLSE